LWAETNGRRWAFSTCNAGARYAQFYCSLADLRRVDWRAVEATDFRDPEVKDGKQAEFLMWESFPWHLVERIGVKDSRIIAKVEEALRAAKHRPIVNEEPGWYY
jgi:hypothetical protein